MPRKRRFNAPGVVYHLISRFVDREWFITNEEERAYYLGLLGRALSASDWCCLAYAVMSNHIHLAAIAGQQSLASWTRRVHSPFADWMNRKHDRIGPMFVRGPKDFARPPERVGSLLAYIHNNPVRAGVVSEPSHSAWTSHRAYLGLERAPRWLHVSEGIARAGIGSTESFDRWVAVCPADPSRDPIDDDPDDDLDVAPDPALLQRKVRVDPDQLVQITADEIGLPLRAIRSRRRGEAHVLARQVAAMCADELGLSGPVIASALCVSQQGISVMLRRSQNNQARELTARVLRRLSSQVRLQVVK